MKTCAAFLFALTLAGLMIAAPLAGRAAESGIFMSVITNMTRITNQVVVTNYLVTTNYTFTTNYYNAQGQLLTPVASLPGNPSETKAAAALAPDPALVRSNKMAALRDLLSLSLLSASNTLGSSGAFSANPTYQIRIPEGVTVFDRKKAQALLAAMNGTAEKSVPGTVAVMQRAIAELTSPDPTPILQGEADAATRAFFSSQGPGLTNQVLAVVQGAAADANLAEAYNAAMLRGGGLLGAVLGTSSSVDINAYVARGLLNSFNQLMGAQEAVIRKDPAARKTKALQEAFK